MGSERKQSLRWPKQLASSAVLMSRSDNADDLPIAAPSKVYSSLPDEKKFPRTEGSGRGVDLGLLWSDVSQDFKLMASPIPAPTSVRIEWMSPLPPPVMKNGSPSFPSISSFCLAQHVVLRLDVAINKTRCVTGFRTT